MKKILASSFIILTSYFALHGSAKADLLYFLVDGFSYEGPKYNFDYAVVGVAKDGVQDWGAGDKNVYLYIQPSAGSSAGASKVLAADNSGTYSVAGPAWADLSDYTADNYTFYIETYKYGNDDAIWGYSSETAKSYQQLLAGNHIYINDTSTPNVTAWNVPEPTSGMLALLGCALLALRRKNRSARASRARAGRGVLVRHEHYGRALLAFSFFVFAFYFAQGAANDMLISFSTPGPDKYADGTDVKDGECYALVWTKTGAAFAGLAADGTAVGSDSKVVVFAPVAKGGRCPTVVFELDAALAPSYTNGTFGIYLCDTRLANGKVGGLNANGVPLAVNGFGEVKSKSEEGKSAEGPTSQTPQTLQTPQTSICVTQKSEVPEGTPKPQIVAIRIVGDYVHLTVKGTVPCLQYAAEEVKVQGQEWNGSSSVAAQGAATADSEITLIVPKKGESGFFRVGRK